MVLRERWGEMKPTKKRKQLVLTGLLVFIILMVLFIWGNSILPARISSAISTFVTKLLGGELEEFHVRKAGHFTEFFLLGGGLGLFFTVKGTKGKEKLLFLSFLAVFVPLMDETIQTFNDRGPQVQDIWIDIAGYTCGCLLALLIACTAKRFLRGKGGHDENV